MMVILEHVLWVVSGQSRMMIHTVVNSKWFGKWKGIPEEDRGEDFKEFKMRFANHLFDWACVHFPKLREKVFILKHYFFA